MGPLETRAREKLITLNLDHLEIENESERHSRGGAETHFKLTMVGEVFAGLSRIDRHRLVNDLLSEELAGGVHALGIRALTGDEWRKAGGTTFKSPDCGSK